jgi:hypothetical protein
MLQNKVVKLVKVLAKDLHQVIVPAQEDLMLDKVVMVFLLEIKFHA